MPTRRFFVEGVGPVVIAKRRGNTNLRLSIKPNREVRLSMPYWTPYIAGERFIKSRSSWIRQQLERYPASLLRNNDQIGKNHRLYFRNSAEDPRAKVTATEVIISGRLDPSHASMQHRAQAACEKALKLQSEKLLAYRLQQLSKQHKLPYRSVRFRKLLSRWGSCSSQNEITLNIFLVQLPWELIDYVLLHELTHTAHMDHSPNFWSLLQDLVPNAKNLRRQIKLFDPVLQPIR